MAPASQSTSHRNLGLAGGCQLTACEQPGRADSSAPSPNLLASSNAPAGQDKILTPASSSSLLTLNLFLGTSELLGCTPTRSVQDLSVHQLVPHPISRGLPAPQSQVCSLSSQATRCCSLGTWPPSLEPIHKSPLQIYQGPLRFPLQHYTWCQGEFSDNYATFSSLSLIPLPISLRPL